ncbi:hypothetical protein F5Y00DRAFT_238795 [Daldinia vernicosa]|uniref:uncharacterized protein n=1 Tax=Daldinia vernicosa TaxID=114800 RepID=UPI002008D407|nr:uncharacterized protein F5Y00DRAFT_238795 [Daldinia vernicosa]KAI0848295.1 hypothetical protein F5Y00DRAFT_238795 [Daldinia vernicosa]
MADEQVSLTSLIFIIVLGGLIIRYLFFSPQAQPSRPLRDAQAVSRAREAAVERIQQIFGPDRVDRRTILWDLHRNGGNIAATTERILAGRIETPPITFQPPPPPTSPSPSATQTQPFKAPPKPAEPDLITRYKLQDKISTGSEPESSTKPKAWSSNRNERQASLQRRRDEMILAARRKMEAKIAAEKAAGNTQQ